MPSATNCCLICNGAPTVKSHLTPRALFHDMRGNSPQLVAGSTRHVAIYWPQSGYWDSGILCGQHESALHYYDDYAVDFIREFETKSIKRRDRLWMVPNTECDRLVGFALAVLWRYSASTTEHAKNVDIGRHEPAVRDALFANKSTAQFGLWIHRYVSEPTELIDIYMAPFGGNSSSRWRFAVGGLLFEISMPNERLSSKERELRLNGLTTAKGTYRRLQQSPEWQGVVDIGANMAIAESKLRRKPSY